MADGVAEATPIVHQERGRAAKLGLHAHQRKLAEAPAEPLHRCVADEHLQAGRPQDDAIEPIGARELVNLIRLCLLRVAETTPDEGDEIGVVRQSGVDGPVPLPLVEVDETAREHADRRAGS